MKVLALYDVHGNVDALDAVLADPRAADPDASWWWAATRSRVPSPARRSPASSMSGPVRWIRGNGEREVAASVGAPPPDEEDLAATTAAISAAEIGDEAARALGDLPSTISVDGVIFCHASPRADDEMLTRLSPPARWGDALAGVDDALVAGHSHQQDDRISTTFASSTRAASAFPMRATVLRDGFGSPTMSRSWAHRL